MKEASKEFAYIDFEHRKQPLISRNRFIRRLILTAILGLATLAVWVLVGMIGYHSLAQLPWVDAFMNAAMIVGGMGPVDLLQNSPAKIFAGLYAILSGVIFLSVFGFLVAPVFHRFLHRFHLDGDDKNR
jgi:hypothetical protein